MIEILEEEIKKFQRKIFSWWKEYKRDFPWRETTNPYRILVSEIMLQQTQAERVVPKFLNFLDRFPNMESLANASPSEVLALWSGLGYNRRAIYLQEAAKYLKDMTDFPRTPEELQDIKGIGKYTSRSILIFAFNKDIATVDTNIRRILIAEGFATEETKEKELYSIASMLLPKGKSRDWHNALMDYGATHLTALRTGIKPTSSQGKFKGSNRQYRGKIVKYLIKNKMASKNMIIKHCLIPEDQIDNLLKGLTEDNLIQKVGKKYSLPR